jgi:hypothetical protein
MATPKKFIQFAAVGLSTVGLIVPAHVAFAETATNSVTETQKSAPQVFDVALGQGGLFNGQMVTTAGVPVANEPVELHHQGKLVAATQTNNDGRFAFQGVRSGQHMLVADEQAGICSLWADGTAPPAALPGVMLVKQDATTRGQGGGPRTGLIVAGVLTGIVIGGVVSQSNSHSSGYGSGS